MLRPFMARDGYASIAIYAFAVLLANGSNFLTVPVLLRLIGPAEFSRWAVIEPVILLLIPIAGLGLHVGLLKLISMTPGRGGAINAILPFHLCLAGVAATLGALIVWLAMGSGLLAVLSGAIVFTEAVLLFFIAYWRARDQPFRFAAVEGGRAFLILIVVAGFAWAGSGLITQAGDYLAARLSIGGIALLFALGVVRPKFTPDRAIARRAIRYGLPIVLAGMAVSVMTNFDRFVVLWVEGDLAVSYYVAHVKVVQILGSALAPFFIWFAPIAIRRLDDGAGANSFFANSFFGFVTVNVALCVGLWLVLPGLWPILFPDVALNPQLMAWLLLGMAIFACGNPLSISILREGKTHQSLLIAAAAILLGAVLVVPLGAEFGVIGVAMGKFGAMSAYTLLFAVVTISAIGVRYPWVRIGSVVAFGAGLAVLVPTIVDLTQIRLALPVASLAVLLTVVAGYGFWKVVVFRKG